MKTLITFLATFTILLSVALLISGAPTTSEKVSSAQYSQILGKELGPRYNHRNTGTNGIQAASRSRDALSKNTYMLLRSLKKVQGHDGRSPVCKICSASFVDAVTYDHFCLPESEGMDGVVCDKLTILGTTAAHQLSLACKMVLSRRPIICK